MNNKIYIHTIIYIFLFLISFSLHAQESEITVREVFENSKKGYEKNTVFQLQLEYTLYRKKETPIIIDKYTGVFAQNNSDFYLKLHTTEILVLGDQYVKVNHTQKAIEYNLGGAININNNPLAIEQYLSNFTNKKVFSDGEYWRCELTTPKYTQLPYGAVTLYFYKTNFQLKKQTFLLVSPKSIKDEKGELTRDLKFLEVIISDYKSLIEIPADSFNINNYINHKDNKVITSSKLKDYKLIDRTIK